ncbi:MAG: hypothetical protein ACLQPN_00385 [Bryobacteraceae bacterium]
MIREFFELFKTPWEFYRVNRQYEVLLCAGDWNFNGATKLALVYSGRHLPFDVTSEFRTACHQESCRILCYKDARIPVYGSTVTFPGTNSELLIDTVSGEAAAHLEESNGKLVARIGYDLFREINTLLTIGQPISNASIPTLDLHIAFLRDLITASGASLMEIPPVPKGYSFIACLTHDVDHPSIRKHRFDHTMLGFLYRAIFGSVIKVFRRRALAREIWTNWVAALKLPFIYLGVVKDFWREFDRYPDLEGGVGSSFFVIPLKCYPGRNRAGLAPRSRASSYGAAEIAGHIQKLKSLGCEVGLHGIDAWLDSSKGREELEEIRRITGTREVGVRMHWLYFSEQSPVTLERAGVDYDSTIGYNETVGYRAGTTQAYKPLEVDRLLELPLHVMDTALFFPTHLDLSPKEAHSRVGSIIDNAVKLGGTVTVNWHDRSIAPERLWGGFYVDLVAELKSKGAWFATAAETVSWFRKRRAATFVNIGCTPNITDVTSGDVAKELPSLQLKVVNARRGAACPS